MSIIESKTGISSIEYKGFLPIELVGSNEYGYLLKFNKIDISIEYDSSVECDVYFTVPCKKISLFMFTYKFKNYCSDMSFIDYVESIVHMVLKRLERVDYTPYIECVTGRDKNYILDFDIVKSNGENRKGRTETLFSSIDGKTEKQDKSTQDKKVKIDVDTEYLNTILECLSRLGLQTEGTQNKDVEKKNDKGTSEIKDKQIPAKAFVEGLIKTVDTLLTPEKDSGDLSDIFRLFMNEDKPEYSQKHKMQDRQNDFKPRMQDRQNDFKPRMQDRQNDLKPKMQDRRPNVDENVQKLNSINYFCDKIYKMMLDRGYTSFTPSSIVYFNYLLRFFGVDSPDEYKFIRDYCNKKFN